MGGASRWGPTDASHGLFFVAADKTETRVKRIIKVRPNEVGRIAPALPAGTYTLEVRAAFRQAGTDLRAGRLLDTLTVAWRPARQPWSTLGATAGSPPLFRGGFWAKRKEHAAK